MDTVHLNRRRLFWFVDLLAFTAIVYCLLENISVTDAVNELLNTSANGLWGTLILDLAVLAVYARVLSLFLAARRLVSPGVMIINFRTNGVLPYSLGAVAKSAYAKQI